MKDLIEKLLHSKYKPLPRASSMPAPGAFWLRWFYKVLHPGFARMRNTLHCISKHRSPYETAGQNMRLLPEGRYIAMRNNTHFIWIKASLQCYCMSCPVTLQKCIGTGHTWLSLTLHANIRDGHMSIWIRYLRVWQFKGLRNWYY